DGRSRVNKQGDRRQALSLAEDRRWPSLSAVSQAQHQCSQPAAASARRARQHLVGSVNHRDAMTQDMAGSAKGSDLCADSLNAARDRDVAKLVEFWLVRPPAQAL